MKDRLIELLEDTLHEWECDVQEKTLQEIAEHLIANGVIALPCALGEDAYFIIETYVLGEVGDAAERTRRIDKRPLTLYEYVEHGGRAYATEEKAKKELLELEKDTPKRIAWNEYARAFYCPTCNTGVENKAQDCPYCGQSLFKRYNF